MSKPTFELKKDEGDFYKNTFVKKGIEVEFTMGELIGYQEQMHKMLTETRAQMDVEIARMKNVEKYHSDAVELVKSLDPLKQTAIKIWLNSKIKLDELGPQKDKILEALRQDQEQFDEIFDQTGVEKPDDFKLPDLNGTPSKPEINKDLVTGEEKETDTEETSDTDSDEESTESAKG